LATNSTRSSRSLVPLLFALLGGVALVYLSVPETIGGFALIDEDHSLIDVEGRPGGGVPQIPLSELTLLVEHWWRAAPWLNEGATWSDTGDLLMEAARATTDDTLRIETLQQARTAYRNALERSPANPRAWSMLASATFELGGGANEVIPLLEMSLQTGRHETILVLARLDLAFDFWGDTDSQLRAELDDQIRLAGRISPTGLARLARRHFMVETVRDALSLEPDLLGEFDLAYERL
jgi:hypothetical protein